jgi:F-box-like
MSHGHVFDPSLPSPTSRAHFLEGPMIDKIPPEVLADAFAFSLPHPVDSDGRRHMQSLRSTCLKWRTVIDSTPSLWATLSASFFDIERWVNEEEVQARLLHQPLPPYSRIISAIRAWFDRAAGCPLTLHITTSPMMGLPSPRARQQIIGLLCEDWNWVELDIQISFINNVIEGPVSLRDMISRIEEDAQNPWRKLKRFSFGSIMNDYYWPPSAQGSPWLVPLSKCAPDLRALELRMQTTSFIISLPNVHHQITTLRLVLVDLNLWVVVTNILQYLPSLQRLYVDASRCGRRTVQHADTLLASSVVQEVEVMHDGVYLLQFLSFPCLRSLYVGGESQRDTPTDMAYDAALDFIRRSDCQKSLRTIDIRDLEVATEREEILEHLKRSLNVEPLPQVLV